MQALPNRNWPSIREQASLMGVERVTRLNTAQIPDRLSYADVEMLEMLFYKHSIVLNRGECYWKVEGDIGLAFWSAHLDQYVQKQIDHEHERKYKSDNEQSADPP